MDVHKCQWLSPVLKEGLLPSPRQGQAVAVNGEDIYLFGGSSSYKSGEGIIYYGDFYRLTVCKAELQLRKLVPKGQPPSARDGHSMCLHGNQIYVYGGKNKITARTCLPGLYVYDIGDQKWEYRHTLGVAPSTLGHTMCCISDILYIYGGYIEGEVSSNMYMLHIKQLTWTKLTTSGSLPPRCDHAAAMVSDNIYIFGGCGGGDVWFNDLHVFNTDTLTWSEVENRGDTPAARGAHVLVASGAKDLYVFGGINDSHGPAGVIFNDLYKYSLSKHKWIHLECSGGARSKQYGHSAAAIQEHMYIFGGMTSQGELGDVNILNMNKSEKENEEKHHKSVHLSCDNAADDHVKVDADHDNQLSVRNPSKLKVDLSSLKANTKQALDEFWKSLQKEIDQLDREKNLLDAERKEIDKDKEKYEENKQKLAQHCENHKKAAKEWLDLREQCNKKDRQNINKQKKHLLID